MKKLIFCAFAFASVLIVQAQSSCFPNPLYVIAGLPGFWPNPQTGPLPDGTINQSYSQTITVIVPADTTIDVSQYGLPFGMVTVSINNLDLVGVDSLPAGMTYACDYAACSWLNNDYGCFKITGTPTVSGVFQVVCSTSMNINIPGFGAFQTPAGPVTYDLTIDGTTTVNEAIQSNLSIESISPNPTSGQTSLRVRSTNSTSLDIRVIDFQGRIVYADGVRVPQGSSNTNMNFSELSRGIYLLEIKSASGERSSRRLVVQ